MGNPKRLRPLLEVPIQEKTRLQADSASEEEVQAVSPRSKHRRTTAELKVCTASLAAAKESFRKCNLALQSARKALDDAVAAQALSGTAARQVTETQSPVITLAATKPSDDLAATTPSDNLDVLRSPVIKLAATKNSDDLAATKPSDANKRLCQEHFVALVSGKFTDAGPHVCAILRAYEEANGTHLQDPLCKSFVASAEKRPFFRSAHDSAVINQVQTLFIARHTALGGMPRARRQNRLASVQAVMEAPRPKCTGAGVGVAAHNAVSFAQAALEEARRRQQASAARLRSEELDQRQAEAEERDAAEEVAAADRGLHTRPASVNLGLAQSRTNPLEID